MGRATDEFAMGSADFDTLVGLRAFDGLSADDILAVGEEQLAAERAARAGVAREIDPGLTELEVVDRVKSEHPADFDGALTEYRTAMAEARQFIIDHGLATVPPNDALRVIETPDYTGLDADAVAFSSDTDWMPSVVLMAKSTYVWLEQLARRFERQI